MRNHPQFLEHTHLPARQRGAILIVSLLLLLVMTVLALTASQTTRFQERMAGNARDLDLSFQSGEAGLRRAENQLTGNIKALGGPQSIVPCEEDESFDPDDCWVIDLPGSSQDRRNEAPAEWDEKARDTGDALANVNKKPQFLTEEWVDVPDALTIGQAVQMSGTYFYVNTARAEGATDSAVTVLETTYAVRH
jgi:type IV pilus assembly protein PilX